MCCPLCGFYAVLAGEEKCRRIGGSNRVYDMSCVLWGGKFCGKMSKVHPAGRMMRA